MDSDAWIAVGIMLVTGALMVWWRWRDFRQHRRLKRLVDEQRRERERYEAHRYNTPVRPARRYR